MELEREQCWAAVKDGVVIMVINMKTPSGINFDAFRTNALKTLGEAGRVMSGHTYTNNNQKYFLARPSGHQNRNKNKKRKVIEPLRVIA